MHRHSEALSPGDRAPGFTLRTQRGDLRSLDEYVARGPVLVAFHRGTW